ncbi:hypothetical protein [Serratia rubidaea]|uniref:hypothetical protein n=1 Tax=Serratia rubidaea TaxID=61652 RepID=UPI0024331F78|nr:hypothetical protein [Serratia rubidaea]MCR1000742.1 hypothetical protein [Serratia rubidaea]
MSVFSFGATVGWIQTVIGFNERKVSRYLMEGVGRFKIGKDMIGDCLFQKFSLKMQEVKWR